MLHTRMSVDSRAATAAAFVPLPAEISGRVFEEVSSKRRRLAAERAIDNVLNDSFPASDPRSWNPGVARPDTSIGKAVTDAATNDRADGKAIGVIQVSGPSGDLTFLQTLVSFGAASMISLVVPFVVLLIGLPFALAIRGLLEVISWVLGVPLV